MKKIKPECELKCKYIRTHLQYPKLLGSHRKHSYDFSHALSYLTSSLQNLFMELYSTITDVDMFI